jgi:hypothetical protein
VLIPDNEVAVVMRKQVNNMLCVAMADLIFWALFH